MNEKTTVDFEEEAFNLLVEMSSMPRDLKDVNTILSDHLQLMYLRGKKDAMVDLYRELNALKDSQEGYEDA